MNIFQALREDHDKQRRLIELLVQTQGDSEGRDELFERLRSELTRHAAAEERHFYVPLMQHDSTQEKARHSVAEHHEIDEAIEALQTTEYSSPAWLTKARQLGELVEHHLEEEEQEVFQVAGKVLSDTDKSRLARDYQQAMQSPAA
jgi:hemerythrin-like domain-containing protein